MTSSYVQGSLNSGEFFSKISHTNNLLKRKRNSYRLAGKNINVSTEQPLNTLMSTFVDREEREITKLASLPTIKITEANTSVQPDERYQRMLIGRSRSSLEHKSPLDTSTDAMEVLHQREKSSLPSLE